MPNDAIVALRGFLCFFTGGRAMDSPQAVRGAEGAVVPSATRVPLPDVSSGADLAAARIREAKIAFDHAESGDVGGHADGERAELGVSDKG